MLKSMTGFGRAEEVTESYSVKVQIKAVNHRYSDITVRLPRYYTFLEDKFRGAVAGVISRGKIEILTEIERSEADDREVKLNRSLAQEYIKAFEEMKELGVKDDTSVSVMSRLNDIFEVKSKEIDEEFVTELALKTLKNALDRFVAMRVDEGARLEESLKGHLNSLLGEIEFIEERSPKCVEEYRNRLKKKLDEVLEGRVADESRIITEAAIFADKISVDEETVRLRSHIAAFEKSAQADEPIGKKLDFIVQEMNREANTIGSKCNDAEIAAHVVEVKSIIEKIREQIQNIE